MTHMTVIELCCWKRLTSISGEATCIMKQFNDMRAMLIIYVEVVSYIT